MLNSSDNARLVFKSQPGPQSDFLRSNADIVIYGGAAGGGKTYALMLECLRHHQNKFMRTVMFRRQSVDLHKPGGLWDEAAKIFPNFRATSNIKDSKWTFPSGYVTYFGHMSTEADMNSWYGSQASLYLVDELSHFLEKMFWFMFSRIRSATSGVAGYLRAGCNPPDGVNPQELWVTGLIQWWLKEDGFPDPHKSGVIRWLARKNDTTFWGSTKQELMDKYGFEAIDCKSFTFIPATVQDNQILVQNDPTYLSNLRMLSENDKNRLLYGNWKVSSAGLMFNPKWLKNFAIAPHDIEYKLITVDTAQKVKEHNDYTVMQVWGLKDKGIYLLDQVRGRFEYPVLKVMFSSFAIKHSDADMMAVEDTVAGSSLIQDLVTDKRLRHITPVTRTRDKFSRACDALPYLSGGYVYVNSMAEYYTSLMSEFIGFRGDLKHEHDDQIDCMLDAIQTLLINPPALIKYKKMQHSTELLCRKIA